MSSVLQCRDAGDVVNFFKAVFSSGECAVPAELVQFIIDNVINKHYRSKNATRLSKTFRKECTESLNKNFPVVSVVPLDDGWTPKYVLGAAFTLIEYQHMLTNSSSYKFYSHETFIDEYGDNLAFGGVEEKDLPLLVSFRNIAIAFFRTVDSPNLKKEMLMFIAGSLSVGKTTTYIMGSGQNMHVDRREVIYHIESGIPTKPWSDKKIESFLNSKRHLLEDESALTNKKQKIDLPLLMDPLPNLSIQQEPASVLVCRMSPPPSLPCRAFATAPGDNVVRTEHILPPCCDISPVEPVMDPLGYLESRNVNDMREMLGEPFDASMPDPAQVDSFPNRCVSGLVSVRDFGADLTDDESCFSVESNPTNAECQEMADFLWQCGFPMCASEAQVDSVEEKDVVKG